MESCQIGNSKQAVYRKPDKTLEEKIKEALDIQRNSCNQTT